MLLRRRWYRGLAADHDDGDVEAVAQEFAGAGYVTLAMEAYADAAVIAARSGRASTAEERALTICAETGVHHNLGPLPETRWVGRQGTALNSETRTC